MSDIATWILGIFLASIIIGFLIYAEVCISKSRNKRERAEIFVMNRLDDGMVIEGRKLRKELSDAGLNFSGPSFYGLMSDLSAKTQLIEYRDEVSHLQGGIKARMFRKIL